MRARAERGLAVGLVGAEPVERGEARVIFDPASEAVDIVTARALRGRP